MMDEEAAEPEKHPSRLEATILAYCATLKVMIAATLFAGIPLALAAILIGLCKLCAWMILI